jgi:Cytochrome c2
MPRGGSAHRWNNAPPRTTPNATAKRAINLTTANRRACAATLCFLLQTIPSWGAGDATRGAAVFQACAACHSTAIGAHLTGPSLGGDAYSVKTADGKINKVWEFNLRFKTDFSELGPARGKPVIVGTGMQGDRASVVFASPIEISRFIKNSCE